MTDRGKNDVKTRQRLGEMSISQGTPRTASSHPETGREACSELSLRDSSRNQLCQHFDFRLVASKTIRANFC